MLFCYLNVERIITVDGRLELTLETEGQIQIGNTRSKNRPILYEVTISLLTGFTERYQVVGVKVLEVFGFQYYGESSSVKY